MAYRCRFVLPSSMDKNSSRSTTARLRARDMSVGQASAISCSRLIFHQPVWEAARARDCILLRLGTDTCDRASFLATMTLMPHPRADATMHRRCISVHAAQMINSLPATFDKNSGRIRVPCHRKGKEEAQERTRGGWHAGCTDEGLGRPIGHSLVRKQHTSSLLRPGAFSSRPKTVASGVFSSDCVALPGSMAWYVSKDPDNLSNP